MTAEFVSLKQLDNLEEGLKSQAAALYADLSKNALDDQRELFSKCGQFGRLVLMQRSHEILEPIRQSGSYDRYKDCCALVRRMIIEIRQLTDESVVMR
ncbi:MAG: hypothetical protein ABL919_08100 [Methylococcales bacterium]|nr:hypothetical protein [Methylococcaceae bacterium]